MPCFAFAKHRAHAGTTSREQAGSVAARRARTRRKNSFAFPPSGRRKFPGACRVAFAQYHREVFGAMQTGCTRERGERGPADARFLQKAGDFTRCARGLPRDARQALTIAESRCAAVEPRRNHTSPDRRSSRRAIDKFASRVSSSAVASAAATRLALHDLKLRDRQALRADCSERH